MLPQQALHCAELRFPGGSGLAVTASSEPRWGYPYSSFLAGRRRP
jgi:hypothetical protein